MIETSRTLHHAKLKNNCPECFDNTGLEITFSQIEKENKLYSRASKEMTSEMKCTTCNTIIYPVSWDEDIERIFEYHRKKANPEPSQIKLKPLAYMLILIDIVAVAAVIYMFS